MGVWEVLDRENFMGLLVGDIGMEFRRREENGKKENWNLL